MLVFPSVLEAFLVSFSCLLGSFFCSFCCPWRCSLLKSLFGASLVPLSPPQMSKNASRLHAVRIFVISPFQENTKKQLEDDTKTIAKGNEKRAKRGQRTETTKTTKNDVIWVFKCTQKDSPARAKTSQAHPLKGGFPQFPPRACFLTIFGQILNQF